MSSPRFEAFLARLYCDDAFLARFLASPAEAMTEAALDEREQGAAAHSDRIGLVMAARSYGAKRQHHGGVQRSLWRRITGQPWLIGILGGVLLLLCVRSDATGTSTENAYPLSMTRGSRLMISVRINGRPVDALLDSGAEATLIDRGHGSDRRGQTTARSPPGCHIGGASDVNIGISILSQFIITTDFAKRSVWLEPRTTK